MHIYKYQTSYYIFTAIFESEFMKIRGSISLLQFLDPGRSKYLHIILSSTLRLAWIHSSSHERPRFSRRLWIFNIHTISHYRQVVTYHLTCLSFCTTGIGCVQWRLCKCMTACKMDIAFCRTSHYNFCAPNDVCILNNSSKNTSNMRGPDVETFHDADNTG